MGTQLFTLVPVELLIPSRTGVVDTALIWLTRYQRALIYSVITVDTFLAGRQTLEFAISVFPSLYISFAVSIRFHIY